MVEVNRLVINSLIATTFLVSMFAGVQGQATIADPAWLEDIAADQGAGAPHGTWTDVLEEVTYYLHYDDPTSAAPGVPSGPSVPGGLPRASCASGTISTYADYEPPITTLPSAATNPAATESPDDKRVVVVNDNCAAPYPFHIDVPFVPTQLVRVYRIEATIYAECSSQSAPNLQVHWLEKQADGSWVPRDFQSPTGTQPWTTLTPSQTATGLGSVTTFTYEEDFGAFGPRSGTALANRVDAAEAAAGVTEKDLRLRFALGPGTGQTCVIHMDTIGQGSGTKGYPSNVRVTYDSGRVNTWIDDKNGAYAVALPDAATTSPANRAFSVKVAQASVLPSYSDFKNRLADPVNYMSQAIRPHTSTSGSGIANEDLDMRIRDIGTTSLVYRNAGSDAILSPADRNPIHLMGQPGDPTRPALVSYDLIYTGALENGRLQAEIFSPRGLLSTSQAVSVGLKGFTTSVVGGATHAINPLEPTVYRVLVTNIGASRDTITTTVAPPGTNWEADVINGRLTLEPGGSEEVLILVTPSSVAAAGSSKQIVVTSTSSFPNEVDAQTLTLTTNVVSGGAAGAQLLGSRGVIEIFPGQQIGVSGLRIQNTAPFLDTYLVKAVFPSDVKGWTASVSPTSRTLHAASLDDFLLTLRAPSDAAQGMKFNLVLQAQRVGSSSATTSLALPVEVVLTPGVEIGALQPALEVRDDGSGCTVDDGVLGLLCFQETTDNDHDRSQVFRLELANPSPVADTYRLTSSWIGTDRANVNGGCNHDGTGSPDWWRVAFGDAKDLVETPTSRNIGTQTITVPPQTTVYRYVQLGWQDPTTCSSRATPVSLVVTATSLTDQSVTESFAMTTELRAAGNHLGGQKWNNAMHAVDIESDRVDGAQRYAATELPASQKSEGGYNPATYGFRVINQGNERDSLVVELPPVPSSKSGWSHRLAWVANGDGGSNTGGISCSAIANTGERRWVCPAMGIGDEASFRLIVQPGTGVALRDSFISSVTVKSSDDSTKSDVLAFTTKAVGQFSFDANALKAARTAGRGADVTLPFQIDNVGTEGDTYTISIIAGPASWKPRLSSDQAVFIPGQKGQTGFVVVTVPTDAATGVANAQTFRVEVKSEGGAGVRVLDYSVQALEVSPFAVGGDPSDQVLLPSRNQAHEVTVKATGTTLNGKNVQFVVDKTSLPSGWDVVGKTSGTATEIKTGTSGAADVTYLVTAPLNALSTSRVPLLVSATADGVTVAKDLVLTLQAEIALHTQMLSEAPQTVIPGGEVVYQVDVVNDALARNDIELTNTALTGSLAGWTVSYQPAELSLGPLEARTIDVIVKAPVNAPAGQNATFEFFATSKTDSGVFDSLSISTIVGFNQLAAQAKSAIIKIGPDQVADFVVTVSNAGTVPDLVRASHIVETTGLASQVQVTAPTQQYEVPVNGSVDVPVKVRALGTIPEQVAVVVNTTFTSILTPTVTAKTPLTIQVHPYRAVDIDGDSIKEYAVDADGATANGYETFYEASAPGGKTSRVPDLSAYLSDAARAEFTVDVPGPNGTTVKALRYTIDGDKDGKVDHFLDHSGDNLPDVYWDPDRNHHHNITILQDIDGDAVADYFVDTRGDGLSAVFNLRTGKFTPLVRVDLDGDGTPDYIVDKNGNGELDNDETVLYSRGGVLVTVLKIDVDGDGKLDDVFDINGDGRVDYFVRSGETVGRAITLRDVNGDGVLDWVYDSNLDGRSDAYYDPNAQTGGHRINHVESFARLVADYWYIPALFGLVLLLFVVLVAVTRR